MGAVKVVVAVGNNLSSTGAVKWTLQNLVAEDDVITLLHVRPPVRTIPTPMGNHVPIGRLSKEIVAAYLKDVNSNTDELLRAYKRLCDGYKVKTDCVIVENDSVQKGLLQNISRFAIRKLILGTSVRNFFTRRFKGPGIAAKVSKHAPSFCSVLVVTKHRLFSVRDAKDNSFLSNQSFDIEEGNMIVARKLHHHTSSGSSLGEFDIDTESLHLANQMPLKWDRPTHPQLSRTTSSTNRMSGREISLLSPYQSFLQSKRQLGMSDFRRSYSFDKGQNLDFQYTSQFESKYIPCKSSEEQIYDEDLEQPFASGKNKENHVTSEAKGLQNVSFVSVRVSPLYEKEMSVGLPDTYDHEVTILRHQLEQALILAEKALKDADEQAVLRMKAEKAAVWAAEKAGEYATKQLEEAKKREQALRAAERAREIAANEAEKAEKALAVVELAKQKARTEARRRKVAEAKSLEEAEARKTVTEALQLVRQRYREYDYEELRAATNNFSDVLKLGEGGYGSVYKGKLHHMTVAIKVLEEDGYQGTREFQREVELLSRIHHPHMVLLLGCCPEKGCLVYEYMSNGSLEDRLACRGGTSPLPWYTRIRIMVEVAIALHSLHSSQPEPIVHRDMKPGNILLDRNFVSKLGDVGLARLVPERFADNNSTYLQETTPVGTFAYIDPEYQRTGTFGPKSDVYALGIVMLQLLTCKPAVGVIDAVEEALACNKLPEVLDYSAGKWPLKETREVAILALHCAQMKRKHRPDVDTLLPTLDRIREFAEGCTIKEACQEPTSKEHTKDIIPARFLCPIVQEVMADPVIVADGYAYDSVATRKWFEEDNTSPLTHISLEHKRLTPNQTLRAVIYECQDKTRGKSAG